MQRHINLYSSAQINVTRGREESRYLSNNLNKVEMVRILQVSEVGFALFPFSQPSASDMCCPGGGSCGCPKPQHR